MVAASLFRLNKAAVQDADRFGIIDIGSNSVRLVVYEGSARIPAILFNEKILAGLGRGIGETGVLEAGSVERAMTALRRFSLLADEMGVTRMRTVATAAVRDASNGPEFLKRIADLGFHPELLSGEEEARMAGEGVLSGIPDAEGIVGDLGGGSLELVRVGGGKVHECVSFPLGVLRIAALRAGKPGSIDRTVTKLLKKADWIGKGEGLPFYMVGGSWRALARLDMHLSDYALPIVHNYRMAAPEAQRLVRVLAHIGSRTLRAVPGLSSARIPMLADAAALLAALSKGLKFNGLVVSANGLREGLLYHSLPEEIRALDPLICATREEGQVNGRFPEHGDLLNRWIAPLFMDESPADERLRHAACLLADSGWRAHPEFRAERGLDAGLHGNWTGIDARGRAMMAHALYVSFGGPGRTDIVTRLCDSEDLARAERWGLAMRLAQRLSGGVAKPLLDSSVSLSPSLLRLSLSPDHRELYGETVERRHKMLAAAFGLKPAV